METRKKAVALLFVIALMRKKPRNCKSIWVREWLSKRKQKRVQFNIFEELRLQEDHEAFRKYLRMHTTSYEELL